MKHYLSINDIPDMYQALKEMQDIKNDLYAFAKAGTHKTLGLLFFNSSLRTRLSTEKAAIQLGMNVQILNVNSDSWQLEFTDGRVMDGTKAEHVREAAGVLSQYCDVLGIRAFPGLIDKSKDEAEEVLSAFVAFATVPIVNLESSTAHPLQGLTDAFTIRELTKEIETQGKTPKVVLTWAPHPKALPHAVANSFIKTMKRLDVNLTITHPEGYDLNPEIVKGIPIDYTQESAFSDADIIYVKNWSSYQTYGKILSKDPNWMITKEKMVHTNTAKVMHCLPVRRNVVIKDTVLDSSTSAVIQQAGNRTIAAQWVLKKLLDYGS